MLHIRTEVSDGIAVMTVAGEVDAANVEDVRDAFMAVLGDGARSLVIDCAQLEFIDSMGLNAIIAANREARLQFGAVTIRHPTNLVLRLLEVTGLDQVLKIET